jgi:hypothetical protein
MPTNLLRDRGTTKASGRASSAQTKTKPRVRRVRIVAGPVSLEAELLNTPTADRIWAALPLHSTAETWGGSVHFETPVESGRERAARATCEPGDICFWSEEDRVIIVYGLTPIAKGAELRLPRPCNFWAKSRDRVDLLKQVVPGEKVSMTVA